MSLNPLSASEPRNLVANGYAETPMIMFEQYAEEAISACQLKSNSTVLDIAEFREYMVKGNAPIQMLKKSMRVVVRG
jgi:hypothetical protein